MKNYIILSLIVFSTLSVQAQAFVKVGKQLTRPTTVAHPRTPAAQVSTYRYRYPYTYAGAALSTYNSYNTLNTYHSEPIKPMPIGPNVFFIGIGILFLLYLTYSGFNEKVQHSRNTTQDYFVHSHSVELANGGGILVR